MPHVRRCHRVVGGMIPACCKNMLPPDKIHNHFNFPAKWVNSAAKLVHRWFLDYEVGMCRVTRLGGAQNFRDELEPVMHYEYMDITGNAVEESSSLYEVRKWVKADKSNL